MKIPVIIDCDPGIDDANAILLALSSEKLDVRAITTVAGNMNIDITTENALKILDLVDKDVKVARGAAHPLAIDSRGSADTFHGKTGLGNSNLPKSNRRLYGKNAIDTIYEIANECNNKLHIIAVGPLTNIAMLFKIYPDVKEKIEHITVMGGAKYKGNVTPAAEFNFYSDPDAASVVFKSGVNITMADLDALNKAPIKYDDIIEITKIESKITPFIKEVFEFSYNVHKKMGEDGFVIYDAITVAGVIDPSIFKIQKCDVQIETKGEYTLGASVVDMNNKKETNAYVTVDVDREKYLNMVIEMMKKYKK